MSSCEKKEVKPELKKESMSNAIQNSNYLTEDDKFLVDFVQNTEGNKSNQRGANPYVDMKIDRMIRVVEASLNNELVNEEFDYENVEFVETCFPISFVTRGNDKIVLGDAISDLHQKLRLSVNNSTNIISVSNNESIDKVLVDIRETPSPILNEKIICVRTVIGKITTEPIITPLNCTYSTTDYWKFWNYNNTNINGKCNGYTDGVGKDATTQLESKYLKCFPKDANCGLKTDIEFSHINAMGYYQELINTNDVTPGDNDLDFLLYYSNSAISNHHDCLSPSELNFYLGNMNLIANNFKPVDKKISKIDVVGDQISGMNGDDYMHSYIIYYSKCTQIN